MSNYLIKSHKGVLEMAAEYDDGGFLKRLEIAIKQPLNAHQIEKMAQILPWTENHLLELKEKVFTVEAMPASSSKVAQWCQAYKAAKGLAYKVSDRDAGMLKKAKVSPELLQAFFDCKEWWSEPKSVGNYVARQNELADFMAHGAPKVNTPQYPDSWSHELERKYEGETLYGYYRHLKSLGFEKKYTPGAGTVWVRY
jgi:hypothetical protein